MYLPGQAAGISVLLRFVQSKKAENLNVGEYGHLATEIQREYPTTSVAMRLS